MTSFFRLFIDDPIGTDRVAAALAGDFECPNQKNRKYAHEEFCDTYWDCREGEAIESVCPDGLVFDSTRRKNLDPCDNPYNVDCEDLVKFSRKFAGAGAHCFIIEIPIVTAFLAVELSVSRGFCFAPV